MAADPAHPAPKTPFDALTERDGESERDYLARCVSDPLALQIKRADIGDKAGAPAWAPVSDELREESRQRLALLEEVAAVVEGWRRPAARGRQTPGAEPYDRGHGRGVADRSG